MKEVSVPIGVYLRDMEDFPVLNAVYEEFVPRYASCAHATTIPNHACVVANLFDELIAVREGEVVARWRVDARGRSA